MGKYRISGNIRASKLASEGLLQAGLTKSPGTLVVGVFGVLLQQALIRIALDVGGEAGPLFLVDQVHDESAELGRVLNLVLGLAENEPQHTRPLAEFRQSVTVMRFQLVALQLQQRVPTESLRNGRRLIERRLRLLVCHFQEEQKRELLDVVAVRQAIIAQDVAVVPEFLNEGVGVGHGFFNRGWRGWGRRH